MTSQAKTQCWCFTINNYSEEDETRLKALTPQYMIYGKEVGASATPHLQGFINLGNKGRKSFVQMKKMIGQNAYIKEARASEAANEKYCSKDGDIYTYGEKTGKQGTRSDLEGAVAERLKGVSYNDMTYKGTYVRNKRNIDSVVKECKEEETRKKLKLDWEAVKLRPWQSTLLEKLDEEPDERTVHWYYGTHGNEGKTWFCKYVNITRDSITFGNGKSADIKYSYTGQRIVTFDYSRSQMEHINYEVVENIKNGIFHSTKYECEVRHYKAPHVVCFANEEPDLSKLSADRWNVVCVDWEV